MTEQWSSWTLMQGSPPFEPGPLVTGEKCKCGRYILEQVREQGRPAAPCWRDTTVQVCSWTRDGSVNCQDCGEYLSTQAPKQARYADGILGEWAKEPEQGPTELADGDSVKFELVQEHCPAIDAFVAVVKPYYTPGGEAQQCPDSSG